MERGQRTKTIYSLIVEEQYSQVAQLLTEQLNVNKDSRAALSLLGYCNVQLQLFEEATRCYGRLVSLCPKIEQYRLYLAQCYYHMNLFDDATKHVEHISDPGLTADVLKLKAAIKYAVGELPAVMGYLEQCNKEDNDTEVNWGCVRFKEENYEGALQHFLCAAKREGETPDLLYNIAICYYKMKDYAGSMRYIDDIIEKALKDHPELNFGLPPDDAGIHSVGNTWTLHKSALVEAFNLKMAIAYKLKDYKESSKIMDEMPPRSEEELDVVSLHNQAVLSAETNPAEAFCKFQFLLQQNFFPSETLINFLLLCCKHEYYQTAAAMLLTDDANLTSKYLTQFDYDFIDAIVVQQMSEEEALSKLEVLLQQQTEILRRMLKDMNDTREAENGGASRKKTTDYEEVLERYLAVAMAQAKVFWNRRNYKHLEKVFQKSAAFCSEEDVWKLNAAHTLFIQEGKYKEAAGFYEPIVRKNFENILETNPIVLANLCVCYILTGQNEAAEELLRKVEKEEDRLFISCPKQRVFHLCIINLVIGTLYCSKSNFEFGISRIVKAMQPYEKKLCSETWLHVKRCFLYMIENLVKHTLRLKDSSLVECVTFLEECADFGKLETCQVAGPLEEASVSNGMDTISYEARLLNVLIKRFSEI